MIKTARGIHFRPENRFTDWKVASHFVSIEKLLWPETYRNEVETANAGLSCLVPEERCIFAAIPRASLVEVVVFVRIKE
jgi:hypothetical protein